MVASPGGRGSGPLADLSPTEINRGDCRAEQLLPSVLSSDSSPTALKSARNPNSPNGLLVLTEVLRGPQRFSGVHRGPLWSTGVQQGPQRSKKVHRGAAYFVLPPGLLQIFLLLFGCSAELLRTRRRSSRGLRSACIMFLARRNVSATVAPAAAWS